MLVKLVKWIWLSCLVMLLSQCGFHLKGEFILPAEIKTIGLSSTDHNSALTRAVKKRLMPYKINVLDSRSSTQTPVDLSIIISPDGLDRRLLSLFSTGQVAEYELIYSVKYQLQFADQEAQSLSFTISREYQDDPDAVLAKSRELDLVLGEMRQQAAERIINQISTSYANHTEVKPQ